ncbi:ComF family protein [Acinetobacter sp. C26M]|uniref:ComF family protein n=1 Tax=unclassified Acinetobacter TaxID=196816 RepID=UPI002036EB0C|nr:MULTISPECIES: phosphoribosyltransferase family protein [unclassified Acinetobacter]USA46924.1 ComF family protein [Acinetobacter sp. C26M]USA50406.1 ComF family protein [Acinetobacter sp. C26G]
MFKRLGTSAQQIFDYFTPCSLCDIGMKHQFGVCYSCWQQLPWLKQSIERNQQQVFVACHYQYPIDRIIQQFKYEQKLHHQRMLNGLLLQLKLPKVHAIVPMPVSTDRLIERGFNQALLLAKALGSVLNVPVWQPVQRLAQHSQKGLSRLERLEDIEQQFVAAPPNQIRYRKVLIIDDVLTTGSSISALSKVLTQLGCQQVYSACVAAAQTQKSSSSAFADTTESQSL